EVDSVAVGAAAIALARSLYLLAGGSEGEAAKIQADEDLIEELFVCFVYDRGCKLMQPYIKSERANAKAGDSLPEGDEEEQATGPPTLYPGPLRGTGQDGPALLKHRYGPEPDDYRLFGRYNRIWDPSLDAIVLEPAELEMFIKGFLAETLAVATAAERGDADPATSCAASPDCGPCAARGGTSRKECIQGFCRCPAAYYHIALDTGLERLVAPGHYKVIDPQQPLWAEPHWDDIGLKIYADPGRLLEFLVIFFGIAAFAVC
ncbi:unnamed protein product, partial [Chrysoparadoxa australica]